MAIFVVNVTVFIFQAKNNFLKFSERRSLKYFVLFHKKLGAGLCVIADPGNAKEPGAREARLGPLVAAETLRAQSGELPGVYELRRKQTITCITSGLISRTHITQDDSRLQLPSVSKPGHH